MSAFFSYEERLCLQSNLKEGLSFKEINRRLGKYPSTISREIRKYSSEITTGYPGQTHSTCKYCRTCIKRRFYCESCSRRSLYCKHCNLCNKNCQDYKEEVCWAIFRAPYICNGCIKIAKCTLVKIFYDAEKAHIRAQEIISDSGSGLCASEQEVVRLNKILSPLVRQGQSLHQIYNNHKDELTCSEKTIYNYIDACVFDVRNIDLPRKVRFCERYKKAEFKVDKSSRTGRAYEAVIGSKGGKYLLTIHSLNTSLMLAFRRKANTSKSVTKIFAYLYEVLKSRNLKIYFPSL